MLQKQSVGRMRRTTLDDDDSSACSCGDGPSWHCNKTHYYRSRVSKPEKSKVTCSTVHAGLLSHLIMQLGASQPGCDRSPWVAPTMPRTWNTLAEGVCHFFFSIAALLEWGLTAKI
jgi:hypothetical protein